MQCMQANPILLVESDSFFMFLLRFVDLAVFVHLSTSLYIIWIQNWIQWIHLDRSVPSIPSVPSVPSPNSGPASFQRPIRPPKYQNAPGITRQQWHPKTRKKKDWSTLINRNRHILSIKVWAAWRLQFEISPQGGERTSWMSCYRRIYKLIISSIS